MKLTQVFEHDKEHKKDVGITYQDWTRVYIFGGLLPLLTFIFVIFLGKLISG